MNGVFLQFAEANRIVALAAVLAAALVDIRIRRIPNAFSLILGVCGVLNLIFTQSDLLYLRVIAFLAVGLVGALLFSRGVIGGGDVKLLAAASLWVEPFGIPRFILIVMMFGGVIGLIGMAVGFARHSIFKAPTLVKGVPYGCAIAGGFFVSIWPSLGAP